MRSKSRVDPGQPPLWDDAATDATDATGRHRATRARADTLLLTHVLQGDDFLSRGWGAGAVLHYTPAQRARRGEVVVVQLGERLHAGEFGLERGRPVLRTDHGTTWLGPHTAVVGLVRLVEPPFLFGADG